MTDFDFNEVRRLMTEVDKLRARLTALPYVMPGHEQEPTFLLALAEEYRDLYRRYDGVVRAAARDASWGNAEHFPEYAQIAADLEHKIRAAAAANATLRAAYRLVIY
jgi:hypothetical protein